MFSTMNDFYTIETPPSSSSTSKDSLDEFFSLYQTKKPFKLVSTNHEQSNSLTIPIDQFCPSAIHEDMDTSLRHSLGNTKLKTRQDVRRFRKFLKRNYNLTSASLIDIDPDTMRKYLIDYLTSIRTRKGLKYDPETLRSYYLSIQRYLKDCNYPYCLRNSPQFIQCRDLIIQMRKEKNQTKSNDRSSYQRNEMIRTCLTSNESLQQHQQQQQQEQIIQNPIPSSSNTCFDHLPISSLPLRKRQKMKYFLESNSSCDLIIYTNIPRTPSPPLPTLSFDAYAILIQFISSSQKSISSFEKLLDHAQTCGLKQRLMLTTLCHQWTGDIRIIHANLPPEINSFLPHILLINTLSKRS